MTFSSIPFLFYFLPLFLAVYFALPRGAKNLGLLAGSLLFYAFGEPVLILALLVSLGLNHMIGRRIAAGRDGVPWLAIGVALNLAGLALFKYAGFVASLLGLPPPPVTQPIGISFYTFQAISFLIDLKRRDAPAPRSFVDTALYISMFPQLIAGPIVRYKSIADQIQSRGHSAEKFADGARAFILGLAQKVLLANTIAEVADAAFDAEVPLTAGAAWVGLLAYSLQIYFDFAGYSNMAIGMGRMMGFELPRNFDFPYASRSLTEFWRRWHMTLSQWFRDYLYIPLGGNRVSPARTYLNLWIVFLLCGLWHGAAFAFVYWGAWHGAFLVMERAAPRAVLARVPSVIGHFYLPLVVALGWVPFRTADMAAAWRYYAALIGAGEGAAAPLRTDDIAASGHWSVLALSVLIALWPLLASAARAAARLAPSTSLTPPPGAVVGVRAAGYTAQWASLYALLFACAVALAGGAYNPFIYFRF